MYNQLNEYFTEKFCCSFQHSLLAMTVKFKELIDKGNAFGVLLTDLSKAFVVLITHFDC